ncbi:MAG TPA: HipA domain-containing protein [Polyangiaceae bacterium]|nr:HipA domain-containing protein [Polyangiaceae bacterium]
MLSGVEAPRLRLGRIADFERLPEGIPTGDGTIYLIERFDRRPGGVRVHMEDFAQVLDRPNLYGGPSEHLAAVVARLCPQSLRALCERLAFCAVCGNGDGHLKNWSLLYPDGRRAALSPAYDIIATVLYPGVDDILALSLGGSDRFESVGATSFEKFARVSGLTFGEVSRWAEDAARRARQVWAEQGADLPFTQVERARLEWHLARVPLGR